MGSNGVPEHEEEQKVHMMRPKSAGFPHVKKKGITGCFRAVSRYGTFSLF